MSVKFRRATDAAKRVLIERSKLDFSVEYPHDDTAWWHDGDVKRGSYCAASICDIVAELERAFVRPSDRNQGLQRRMIRLREAWARRQGATYVTTYTSHDNVGSMRSLIACGYSITRVTELSDDEIYVRWLKRLSGPVDERIETTWRKPVARL